MPCARGIGRLLALARARYGSRMAITAPTRGLNNRIDGSHWPMRRREKAMGRFKSSRQAERFFAAHDPINSIVRPCRYRLTAKSYRHAGADAFSLWTYHAREMTD